MKNILILLALISVIAIFFVNTGCRQDKLENPSARVEAADGLETVVLGGGCFWSMEAIFSQLKGVHDAEVGYAGGHTEDPTYEEVCTKDTGHAEVVKIIYDPGIISFKKLLEVFFYVHDPTTLNRQGNDVGEQYRSIILYTSTLQEEIADDYIDRLDSQGVFSDPIVTQVEELDDYYRAEDYHQEYYEKNPGQPYCSLVVGPKVDKFEEKFADLLN
jgi:peptide-methionine (S)-S-oxide reductase